MHLVLQVCDSCMHVFYCYLCFSLFHIQSFSSMFSNKNFKSSILSFSKQHMVHHQPVYLHPLKFEKYSNCYNFWMEGPIFMRISPLCFWSKDLWNSRFCKTFSIDLLCQTPACLAYRGFWVWFPFWSMTIKWHWSI